MKKRVILTRPYVKEGFILHDKWCLKCGKLTPHFYLPLLVAHECTICAERRYP